MLESPPLAGRAESRLDFVEDQQKLCLVGQVAELLKELLAEVVVTAFTLNRLDDQSSNVIGAGGEGLLDFGDGSTLRHLDFFQNLRRYRGNAVLGC